MIRYLETTGSTQSDLKEWLKSEAPPAHLDAIRAGVQTSGRGRMGRDWVSTEGNLFASIYFENFTLPLTWIPLWIGVALHQTLVDKGYPEERMHLKWPNDLYLDREFKGAGILCEKTERGIAAGVGVNLISHPNGIGRETASLQSLRGLPLPRDSAETLLQKLIQNLKQEPRLEDLRSEFEHRSLFKSGESVSWVDSRSGSSHQGRVQGLGDFGELRVLGESGEMLKLYSEEISGIRKK